MRLTGTWLTLRCAQTRARTAPPGSHPVRVQWTRREAEGTRDAQESWRVRSSRCGKGTWRDRALAATGSPVGDDARDVPSIPASAEPRARPGRHDVTEGTREPQECWGTYRREEVLQSSKGVVALWSRCRGQGSFRARSASMRVARRRIDRWDPQPRSVVPPLGEEVDRRRYSGPRAAGAEEPSFLGRAAGIEPATSRATILEPIPEKGR
jgi:hypothetical protein